MKFGFEREYFVTRDGTFIDVSKLLPHDDCGFLAEARGEPHLNPVAAAALLEVEERRIRAIATKLGLELQMGMDVATLPAKQRAIMLRRHGKGAVGDEQGSAYGRFWTNEKLSRAGLHVHFSNERVLAPWGDNKESRSYFGNIDMPRFIYGLDRTFAAEIKAAKRVPGLYEMKSYGFEYRSLPMSVDLYRVAEALENLSRERWTEKT
jgi:hypothetical protein